MTPRRLAEVLLLTGLRTLRIPEPADVSKKLLEFAALLFEENQRTNLTGARDLETLVTGHVLDSLAPLALIELSEPILDVGSGAGFPGIPAAIAYPSRKFILVEPRAKRAAFLQSAVARLALANASVVRSSGRGPAAAGLSGRAGTVLMRAVAKPEAAMRLGMPLLKRRGTLLLYEGRSSRPNADQRKAALRLGGGLIEVKRVLVPSLEAVRHAWIIRRTTAATPKLRFNPHS